MKLRKDETMEQTDDHKQKMKHIDSNKNHHREEVSLELNGQIYSKQNAEN